MKIIATSDIHQQFDGLSIPECDLVVVGGDFSDWGTMPEVGRFYEWFREQPARYKLFHCGNHELDWYNNQGLYKGMIPDEFIYLENSGIEIEGIKVWASPYSVTYGNWGFMKTDEQLKPIWNMIPYDLDILCVHTPPYQVLDANYVGNPCGSSALSGEILKKKPKVLVSGHIHESYGVEQLGETVVYNVAHGFEENPPIEIKL